MEITPALIAKKLNAAADLLETKGWTKGELARNVEGKKCAVLSRSANCFCVIGAIQRVCREQWILISEVTNLINLKVLPGDLVTWNDTRRSAKPVIAALRGAAKQVLADA